MVSDLEVTLFRHLFAGRTECFGSEVGSCIHRPVDHRRIRRHLEGDGPIGIFPHRPGDTVNWGAIDIDYVDDPAPAVAAQEVWKWYGVTSFVERSRSKGWHVWVFFNEAVPCALARGAIKAVAKMAGLDPRTEVYPKADTLPTTKVGNYLRLPYPGGDWLDGHRAVWGHVGPTTEIGFDLAHGWFWDLEGFLGRAYNARIGAAALGPLHHLQTKVWGVGARAASEAVQTITEAVLGRVMRVQQDVVKVAFGEDQVQEGQRDLTFFTMAKFLAGSGVSRDMALNITERVWQTRTDQGGHVFSLTDALAKVERAYQQKEQGAA